MDKNWAYTRPKESVRQNRIFSPLRVGTKTIELPFGFDLLTKWLQNKLLNYPRVHIINSQSLNTNMVQITVEQRTFLVKNFLKQEV